MKPSPRANSVKQAVVRLRRTDNVGVACRPLQRDEILDLGDLQVQVLQPIPFGHKVALHPIQQGGEIVKYGQIIGFASRDVVAGGHVHVQNCEAKDFQRDYAFATEVPPPPPPAKPRTFPGYLRPDGRVGTRNYIAVVSTVNCSASTSKYMVERLRQSKVLKDYPGVDGILPLTHKTGCGMAFDSPDHHQLARTLAGFARHPNIAAYLIVGLGCEISQASFLVDKQKLVQVEKPGTDPTADESERVPVITIQDQGGITKTVEAGVKALTGVLARVNSLRRTAVPASKLILGTECGGSDGNSGVTANPAVGVASDRIVAQGGTAILAETPEIYGAEHLLTRRATSREVGEALVDRIRWWEWYAGVFGATIDNNPTPGNKQGGLTTIYEKSLGAIAKGGSTALRAVYRYAETVDSPGLVIMDTPGFDPASITGMVAGGANVCVFTTGRGSVYGCKPTPCLKIATNTPMYERMESDMDINAGVILEGTPVEELGEQIFEEILAVAGGKKTKSELQGVGEEEFVPWSIGPML